MAFARHVLATRFASTLLLVVGSVATVVACALWLTGGFRYAVLGLRVSASNLDRPLAVAVIAWLVVAVARPDSFSRIAPRWVIATVLGCLALFSARHAAPVAAGADMFGYVAQAHDWRADTLVHPVAPPEPLSFPHHAYVPLGYVWQYPPPSATALYPPGTSLHMALASVVAPGAVYLVAPLAALIAVFGTYRLGATYFDHGTGAWAAALLAFSPQLLLQAIVPMSDTLATAYWVWALVCAGSRRLALHGVAGILVSMAVLVRPSLAPLAAGVLLCSAGVAGLRGALTMTVATIPLLAWLGWHNTALYGGPLATGYGPAGGLFALHYIPENVSRYGGWLVRTISPLPFLGAAAFLHAIVRRRQRVHLGLWVLLVLTGLIHICYQPWPNWTFSRFLLPAFPVLFVLAVVGMQQLGTATPLPIVATILICIGWEMHFVQNSEIRYVRDAMSRFEVVGRHLQGQDHGSAVITRIHSGSLRYYASATTVRWDQLTPATLAEGIRRDLAAGRRPLLIDDSDDREDFVARFGALTCWADTAAPLLTVTQHADVRVLTARLGCN
jgi:hypothetical protein